MVFGVGAEAVGTKCRDAEVHQPVVAAEVDELVRAPEATVVVPRSRRRDQCDIDHSEGCRVFEQECEEVTLIENLLTAFVPQRSIMFFADVEVPCVAGDHIVVARGAHEAAELVGGDPGARRTLGQGVGDGVSAGRQGGEPALALAGLSLDALDARQLVDDGCIDPLEPEPMEGLGGGLRECLSAGGSELQLRARELREPPGLHDERPGEGADRRGVLIVPLALDREDWVVVAALQHVGDGLDGRDRGASRLVADGDLTEVDEAQYRGQLSLSGQFGLVNCQWNFLCAPFLGPRL